MVMHANCRVLYTRQIRAVHVHPLVMEELLRTNDITLIPFVKTLLSSEDIPSFEMDVNMSVLEGSIGIFPRRLMVRSDDLTRAKRVLQENGVSW